MNDLNRWISLSNQMQQSLLTLFNIITNQIRKKNPIGANKCSMIDVESWLVDNWNGIKLEIDW